MLRFLHLAFPYGSALENDSSFEGKIIVVWLGKESRDHTLSAKYHLIICLYEQGMMLLDGKFVLEYRGISTDTITW